MDTWLAECPHSLIDTATKLRALRPCNPVPHFICGGEKSGENRENGSVGRRVKSSASLKVCSPRLTDGSERYKI